MPGRGGTGNISNPNDPRIPPGFGSNRLGPWRDFGDSPAPTQAPGLAGTGRGLPGDPTNDPNGINTVLPSAGGTTVPTILAVPASVIQAASSLGARESQRRIDAVLETYYASYGRGVDVVHPMYYTSLDARAETEPVLELGADTGGVPKIIFGASMLIGPEALKDRNDVHLAVTLSHEYQHANAILQGLFVSPAEPGVVTQKWGPQKYSQLLFEVFAHFADADFAESLGDKAWAQMERRVALDYLKWVPYGYWRPRFGVVSGGFGP